MLQQPHSSAVDGAAALCAGVLRIETTCIRALHQVTYRPWRLDYEICCGHTDIESVGVPMATRTVCPGGASDGKLCCWIATVAFSRDRSGGSNRRCSVSARNRRRTVHRPADDRVCGDGEVVDDKLRSDDPRGTLPVLGRQLTGGRDRAAPQRPAPSARWLA